MIKTFIFLVESTLGKSNYSTFGSVLELVGLVLLCVVIIAASYFVTKFIGTKQLGQYKDSNFKIIDSYRISQNKVIQLLQVGSKYIVIAVCKDSITMLTELSEDQITNFRLKPSESKRFKEILNGFIQKKDTNIEKVDTHEEDY